jgi:dipeptidyl aminopeptidase/acylaminoacyl peptidase
MPIVSSIRADGTARLAYVRRYIDTNIWRITLPVAGVAATAAPIKVVSSTRHDVSPSLSPDGKRLAFNSTRSGESEIWTMDVDGHRSAPLTDMRLNPGFPRWSPDGRFVAFQSNGVGGGRGDIFVVSSDGGQVRNLTAHPANDAIAVFSRDGRWIYFLSTRGGLNAVWKIPSSGGPAVQVIQRRSVKAIESPDGTRLYFTDGVNGISPSGLWERLVSTGHETKIADNVIGAAFEVIEAGIYFVERTGASTRIKFHDPASGRQTVVAENIGPIEDVCASADGRTIYFGRVDNSIFELMLVDGFK